MCLIKKNKTTTTTTCLDKGALWASRGKGAGAQAPTAPPLNVPAHFLDSHSCWQIVSPLSL